ncbi:hypothetical protein DL98DRAFT_260371 [Cadophora sp. DSE1049]|nr:hypothetical protein DL98DRAFT_260371 [Cadophora sp. DSE1049]
MNDSKNGFQGEEVPSTPPHTTFIITPDLKSKKVSSVHRDNSAADSQPLYTVTSKSRKPHVTLTQGSTTSTIGTATFHKFSSFNTDLQYRGQTITMRPSLSTGFHQFYYPGIGKLEWRTEGGKKEVELRDGREKTLARLRDLKAICRTETELIMEIKCSEEFEGFLVLSAIALGVRSHLVVATLGDAIGVTAVGTGV